MERHFIFACILTLLALLPYLRGKSDERSRCEDIVAGNRDMSSTSEDG